MLLLLLIALQLQPAFNDPQSHHAKRSPLELKRHSNDLPPVFLTDHEIPNLPPIFAPLLHSQTVPLVTVKTNTRKKKGPNIPLSSPIAQQILVPAKLHVIPAQSNIHHSAVHTDVKHVVTKDNFKIPIISQTVSHSTANITHPTPLIPILIPIHHNHLVPVHDLTVIPLQPLHREIHKEPKISHVRLAMEKKDDDEEGNRYRTFYGGYGTGLFFGGHGAGHGFYAYG